MVSCLHVDIWQICMYAYGKKTKTTKGNKVMAKSGTVKTTHRGIENHQYAVEMHGLRSSGASGTHGDRRFKRERSKNASRSKAISRSRSEA